MPHTNTRTHKNMTACKTMNLSRQDKLAKPTYDSRKEAFAEKEKRLSERKLDAAGAGLDSEETSRGREIRK